MDHGTTSSYACQDDADPYHGNKSASEKKVRYILDWPSQAGRSHYKLSQLGSSANEGLDTRRRNCESGDSGEAKPELR